MTHTNNEVFGSIEHTTIIYPRDLWFIHWIMGSQGWFVSTCPLILLHMNFQQTFVCMSKVFVCVNNFVPNCCGYMSTTFCNMSVILWQNFGSIQSELFMILRGSIDDMQIFTLASFFRADGLPAMNVGGKRVRARMLQMSKRSIFNSWRTSDLWPHFEQVSSHVETVARKQKRGGMNYESPKVSYHCTSWAYIRDAYTFNLWSI